MRSLKQFLLIFCAASVGFAQTPKLSGFWELRFDSFNVPEAALTSAAKTSTEQRAHDTHAIRWCYNLGVPNLMSLSPIDVIQNMNGKEVALTFPYRGPSRHIYTDGRKHINPDVFDPSSSGDSVGHWEGETLVVDTVGFSDEGVIGIPGGGRRTASSHLVERYRLVRGGQQLSVTFTWEDSKIYAKPHTYEFRYYRAPKGTEAREFECNPSDEERTKFLTGPPGGK